MTILWHNIGWSGNDPALRNVRRVTPAGGWAGYVASLPAHTQRLILHNPYGAIEGEPMQFEQRRQAREAGLDWLAEGEAAAWRSLTRKGVEIIIYLGSPSLLPDTRGDDWQTWLIRALAELAPALDSGCSLAFDASHDLPADSHAYRLIRVLQLYGHRVYIEPLPLATHPHLHDLPAMARERWFEAHGGDSRFIAPDAELIELIAGEATPDQIKTATDAGRTPATREGT